MSEYELITMHNRPEGDKLHKVQAPREGKTLLTGILV
jgi:hypothetical protein